MSFTRVNNILLLKYLKLQKYLKFRNYEQKIRFIIVFRIIFYGHPDQRPN